MADAPIFIDGFTSFELGINSGVAPLLLPPNQLSYLINGTVRGAYVTHRPSYWKVALDFDDDAALQEAFEKGLWQFGCFFKSEYGAESMVVQVGGRLFEVTPDANRNATVVERTIPGDPNPNNIPIAFLWQAERWMIIQDGQSLAIFFDGQTSRRSRGPAQQLGLAAADFTAPAIGDTVSVTLTGVYTGPFNETVLVDNEAFYQVTQGSAFYPVTLQAIEENSNGTTFPANSLVVVPTNLVGIIAVQDTVGFGGSIQLELEEPATLAVNQVVQIHINNGGLYASVRITIGGVNATSFQGQSLSGVFTAKVGSGVYPSSPAFSSDGTKLATAFVQPAPGASFTANFSKLYTGALPAILAINQCLFRITAVEPDPGPSATIVVENVSDVPGNIRGPTGADGVGNFTTVPEMETGKMGAYGMGRNWYSLPDGRSYRATDIVGGPSGSPAYNFRDSVLRETENTFLTTGDFVIPGNIGDIRSLTFPAILDASLGQGPLQIGTPRTIFSCNAPVDRTTWQDLENPIQTQSLKGYGPLNHYGTINDNSDILFRSIVGWGSLIQARRDFKDGHGNTPISREIERIIVQDDVSKLEFGSKIVFNNRVIDTTKPTDSPQGVFHQGAAVLNNDPLSSMAGKYPAVYDGLWTGINVLEWITGSFAGVDRTFAFCFNTVTEKIELFELLLDGSSRFDNDLVEDVRIKWAFETGCHFKDVQGKNQLDLVKLIDGEMYVSSVAGRVDYEVYYRTQFDPCWHFWKEGSICATEPQEGTEIRAQNRVAVGLGRPPVDDCDSPNNRPPYIGETFQFKFVFTGSLKVYGALFKASAEPKPFFEKPICGDQPCKTLSCPQDDDYALYEFEDRPEPEPTPSFFNQAVIFDAQCEEGETLSYDGTLPSWITLDEEGGRLIGAAGTFEASSQAEANSIAQAALDSFAENAISEGDLECAEEGATLIIEGYVDGLFAANLGSNASGEPVWDGTFTFLGTNETTWKASNDNLELSMDSKVICNVYILLDEASYVMEIWASNNDGLIWSGSNGSNVSPLGTYTRTDGDDLTPESVVVISNPDPVQATDNTIPCRPS